MYPKTKIKKTLWQMFHHRLVKYLLQQYVKNNGKYLFN